MKIQLALLLTSFLSLSVSAAPLTQELGCNVTNTRGIKASEMLISPVSSTTVKVLLINGANSLGSLTMIKNFEASAKNGRPTYTTHNMVLSISGTLEEATLQGRDQTGSDILVEGRYCR